MDRADINESSLFYFQQFLNTTPMLIRIFLIYSILWLIIVGCERPVLVLGSWMLLFTLGSNDFWKNIPFLVYSKTSFYIFFYVIFYRNYVKKREESRLERLPVLCCQNNFQKYNMALALEPQKVSRQIRTNETSDSKSWQAFSQQLITFKNATSKIILTHYSPAAQLSITSLIILKASPDKVDQRRTFATITI